MGTINWVGLFRTLLPILRTVGLVMGQTLLTLLSGRFFKRLVIMGMEKMAGWANSKKVQLLVEEAKKDFNLEDSKDN